MTEHWHVWVRSPTRKTFWQWLDAGGLPKAFRERAHARGWATRRGWSGVDRVVASCRARACGPDVPRPQAW